MSKPKELGEVAKDVLKCDYCGGLGAYTFLESGEPKEQCDKCFGSGIINEELLEKIQQALTALREPLERVRESIMEIKPFFTSGNSIPVERAVLKSSDVEKLFASLAILDTLLGEQPEKGTP